MVVSTRTTGGLPFQVMVWANLTTVSTLSKRLCAKVPLRIQCDILERRKEFGKRREVSLMGNRITRAARHLPAEAVHERIRGEKRPWRRQRWEIIYQALTAPRPAEDIARTVGVSLSTVHRVIATYKQGGVAAIETPGKGGRRHQYLTLQQERAFLQPFLARAAQGEIATVTQIQQAYEERVRRPDPTSTIYSPLN